MTEQTLICVVGAGIAGLSAARTLREHGIRALVLEASDFVGGRARTSTLCSIPAGIPGRVVRPQCTGRPANRHLGVELGANWFHGTEGNAAYEYALHHGLMDQGTPGSASRQAVPRKKGARYSYVRPGMERPLDGHFHRLATLSYRDFNRAMRAASEGMSVEYGSSTLGAWLEKAQDDSIARIGLQEDPEGIDLFRQAWYSRELLQRAIDGSNSTSHTSSASEVEYHDLPGGNITMPGGFSRVMEHMAEGLEIRHSFSVKRICWGGRHPGSSKPVRITGCRTTGNSQSQTPTHDRLSRFAGEASQCTAGDDADGTDQAMGPEQESIDCDGVIVTVPLGVLQRGEPALEPPLPDAYVAAIHRLQMGIADKIWVRFNVCPPLQDEAQQDAGSQQYTLLWPEQLIRRRISPANNLQSVPPPTVTPDLKHSWLAGIQAIHFAPSPEVLNWNEGEASSAKADPKHVECVGIMWITGDEALEAEACSDEALVDAMTELLEVFPAIRPPFGTWAYPPVDTVCMSMWGRNTWSHGSYSYLGPNATGEDIALLSQNPVPAVSPASAEPTSKLSTPSKVLALAGEHTSRHRFGTLDGAAVSGVRAAASIIADMSDHRVY